ncbi:MAG: hypothetical protein KTR30_20835 [Saprospiraceae bacterium]|nr:hypothetical protein [Saprospiraceae bacterium]
MKKDVGIDERSCLAILPFESLEIPVPATFIIEQNGTVSFAESAGDDYRDRVGASELLQALRSV